MTDLVMGDDGSRIGDSDNDHEYDAGPYYGIRMRAADPRYITEGNDINRGDVLLTIAQVRQLIDLKASSAAEIATIWLTTAEMGFSLTAEPNEITCPQDAREGKVSDRFLAPAISRFATWQACLQMTNRWRT